jgi:hypothetical protein
VSDHYHLTIQTTDAAKAKADFETLRGLELEDRTTPTERANRVDLSEDFDPATRVAERVIIFGDPDEFCERHKGNVLVRRCCHFGQRSVVEMRIKELAVEQGFYVDYVEDLDNGDMGIESSDLFRSRAEGDEYWQIMVDKMMAGRGPTLQSGDKSDE